MCIQIHVSWPDPLEWSQFLNMTKILPAGFTYFENDVFVAQLKLATTMSFDKKGHNSQMNFHWFKSYSTKEEFTVELQKWRIPDIIHMYLAHLA